MANPSVHGILCSPNSVLWGSYDSSRQVGKLILRGHNHLLWGALFGCMQDERRGRGKEAEGKSSPSDDESPHGLEGGSGQRHNRGRRAGGAGDEGGADLDELGQASQSTRPRSVAERRRRGKIRYTPGMAYSENTTSPFGHAQAPPLLCPTLCQAVPMPVHLLAAYDFRTTRRRCICGTPVPVPVPGPVFTVCA